jgi:hypothetical protein
MVPMALTDEAYYEQRRRAKEPCSGRFHHPVISRLDPVDGRSVHSAGACWWGVNGHPSTKRGQQPPTPDYGPGIQCIAMQGLHPAQGGGGVVRALSVMPSCEWVQRSTSKIR